jgi:uncharacterized cysteine cluster protein YcgN (CxxCxxCC family)
MTVEAWDSLCRRCGSCCFEKIEDDRGTIFYTQTPCRYLDVVTRECRVFENRFSTHSECMQLTPELVETLRWLPPDCGYRVQAVAEEAPHLVRRRPKRKSSKI